MPASRRRSSLPTTASTRPSSRRTSRASAPARAAAARSSGGVNVGKSFSGKSIDPGSERAAHLLSDAADAFSLIERIIERENIQCFWEKRGRFVGAWTPKHYDAMARTDRDTEPRRQSGCFMVPRERQREEIASDYYHGGMVVERSAKLHPALYYKGLLDAARRRRITICGKAPVSKDRSQRHEMASRDRARRYRGR